MIKLYVHGIHLHRKQLHIVVYQYEQILKIFIKCFQLAQIYSNCSLVI